MADITIMILTYNHAWSLAETLDSLLTQTFQDFHLLIVDDQSSDDSHAIALGYQSRFKSCKVIRNERNLGSIGNSYASAHLAVAQAPEARFFLWACPDDVWSPTYLEVLRQKLLDDPDVVVCQTYIEEAPAVKGGQPILQRLLPLSAETYRTAKEVFYPVILPGSQGNYNQMIHGLIRMSELRSIFVAERSMYARSLTAEISLLIAMLMRGDMDVVPEHLFHKKHEVYREDRYPHDELTRYYKTLWRRAWAAAGCLPWLLRIRKPGRSLAMVLRLWLRLVVFYAHLSLYREAKRIEKRLKERIA